MTKIYISGKMSGLPNNNYPAFFKAESILNHFGHETINPASIGEREGWKWEDYMKKAVQMMMDADEIVLLPGWETSRGAKKEKELAEDLNMSVHLYKDLLEKGMVSSG